MERTTTYKGCVITVSRPNVRVNWYIEVQHPDGGYLYDGWWRDSENMNADQAIAEAKKGSLLDSPAPETNEEERI